MQLPMLARFDARRYIPYNNFREGGINVAIPTVRFRSYDEWRRTSIKYTLKDKELVVVISLATQYYLNQIRHRTSYRILPLIPLLNGTIKKNALKWVKCKDYYPTLELQHLSDINGTPLISDEESVAEIKAKRYASVIHNVLPKFPQRFAPQPHQAVPARDINWAIVAPDVAPRGR